MGMFDTVHCKYPLPNSRHQDLEFQTKDLECLLGQYTITRGGRLVWHARRGRWGGGPDRDIQWPLHGDIRIYTSVKTEDPSWVEYVVRFTHGQVEWIRPVEEGQTPNFASLDWDLFPDPPVEEETAEVAAEPRPAASEGEGGAPPSAEDALLQSLRRDREELGMLLARCSDHWVYEDSIYRFYHQSFKVYGLQGMTQAIVQRLQALAPDRPLNSWFLQIVEAGTGKTFQSEDNARWMEVTRPIVEAFFHARFFLE
ncbi:MAG TPA: hypothetical protein VGM86_18135, partial [Thermoanaerobaculia bacterium]